MADEILDVRSMPPAKRHETIFDTFESLTPGTVFVLVNDHDPKPLYYQFQAEMPGAFTWDYLEEGPEVWRVRIGKTGGPEAGDQGDEDAVILDVRPDLKEGNEPFHKIMKTVDEMGERDTLVLYAPFQPEPLYKVLGKKGFAHEEVDIGGGDWKVIFTRQRGSVYNLDNRGLEPPEPLMRVLEHVELLKSPDDLLVVRNDRRPMFLYPKLEQRGLLHETEDFEDGSVRLKIWRSNPKPDAVPPDDVGVGGEGDKR